MQSMAKLGLAVGGGAATTIIVDSALRYFTDPLNEQGEENWYYKHSSLVGAGASLITAGILWKFVGKEEGVAAGVAGLLAGVFIPTRVWVDEQGAERRLTNGTTSAPRSLPAGNPAVAQNVANMARAAVPAR